MRRYTPNILLRQWRQAPQPLVVARVTLTRGSTPREEGAFMLVGHTVVAGTVGGGALELACEQHARAMLHSGEALREQQIVLGGTNVSQCCGGRVAVRLEVLTPPLCAQLEQQLAQQAAERPSLFLFGAGHVGRALAYALAPLPLRLVWVDPRAHEFGNVPDGVEACVTSAWEDVLATAPPGAGVLVLTPSHTLDALIVEAALQHPGLAYVGLIGSRTKRLRFEKSLLEIGVLSEQLAALVCPIGDRGVRDKRPEIIAALVAAEVVEKLLHPAQQEQGFATPSLGASA
ncbi:xanthine dehydrogenase accessory protein XdhC [Acetobacter lambici]|uniref:Xanthine dehydrogenase accessory protein XdhC n=1 Tax=Acetobacter lambici TaxID=1332824 RepID=A0ABT1EZ87_9PROT|nr:xanthine dehydrogenase accessory protein XdhC [Acetobacter lambici]MCP1242211.1 xanthine dehydrogenase accessory protein XdhC [Acetobacter lambici]MCP1258228.1 xanthine dehydrogenase accessory protein XdhC [Acetobacter lambici]NHO56751.1 xanthine dehydrogenase accessory protein XdhC [Acetobacter lambici]